MNSRQALLPFLLLFFFFFFFIAVSHLSLQVLSQQVENEKERHTLMQPIETEVVVADYTLLRKSFPCILEGKSDAQINDWLKKEAGYFRKTHLDAIPAGGDRPKVVTSSPLHVPKTARVPLNYGRAAVVPLSAHEKRCNNDQMWLDIKGTGSDSPKWEAIHKSGILDLTYALQEFFMEKWISFLFNLPESTKAISGVNPSYAVLVIKHVSSPFPITWENRDGRVSNMSDGWAIVVRKYAARDANYALEIDRQYAVEGWLRRHGLSGLVAGFMLYYPEARTQHPSTLPLVLDYQKTRRRHLIDFSVLGLYQEEDPRRWHSGQKVYPIHLLASFDSSTTTACVDVRTETLLKKTLSSCLEYMERLEAKLLAKEFTQKHFEMVPAVTNRLGVRRSLQPAVLFSRGYYSFLGTTWWELWEPSEQALHWPRIVEAVLDHRQWRPQYQSAFQHLFTAFQMRLSQAYQKEILLGRMKQYSRPM